MTVGGVGTFIFNGMTMNSGVVDIARGGILDGIGDVLDVSGAFEIGSDVIVNLFLDDLLGDTIDLSDFFAGLPIFESFSNTSFGLFTSDLLRVGSEIRIMYGNELLTSNLALGSLSSVPEPETLLFLAFGLAVLGGSRLRRA